MSANNNNDDVELRSSDDSDHDTMVAQSPTVEQQVPLRSRQKRNYDIPSRASTLPFYATWYFKLALVFAIMIVLIFALFIVIVLFRNAYQPLPSNNNDTTIQQLYQQIHDYQMQQYPERASVYLGNGAHDARLTDMSVAALNARHSKYMQFAQELQNHAQKNATLANTIDYQIMHRLVNDQIGKWNAKLDYMPLSQMHGVHIDVPNLFRDTVLRSVQDFDHYYARMEAYMVLLQQVQELMRIGVQQYKLSQPKFIMHYVVNQIQLLMNHNNTLDNVFYNKIRDTSVEIGNAKKLQGLQIVQRLLQALQQLIWFLQTEYIPRARDTVSLRDLPNGAQIYQFMIQYYTTLNVTAEELHRLGLAEVARIKVQLEKNMRDAQFDGTFAQFLAFLKNDSQFYATSEQQFLMLVRDIAKKTEPYLPLFFKSIPKCPYGIYAVPENEQAYQSIGYYSPPDKQCTKPGKFMINTFMQNGRVNYPLYLLPSTTIHEGVPGHAFQGGIALELDNLPVYRRGYSNMAYGEGWALYSEALGFEMPGLYDTPYIRFGALGDEMLRACRLVVDTGIHYYGWSREQALQYMRDNMPSTEFAIVNQVDRYISFFGQALSYKAGQLKMNELKNKVKQHLGEAAFDIRVFHDNLLKHGALPLNVLEQQIYLDYKMQ